MNINFLRNMLFFKYIFFRIYILYRRKHDEIESAVTALLFVNLFMFMNFFSIGGILNKFELLPVFFKSSYQVIIFIIILFFINYITLVHKKTYRRIHERFVNNTNYTRNGWIVIIYLIITIVLVFAIPFIK